MREQIRSFLGENFPFDSALVGDEDSLMDSGILDSIAVLVLVTWLEESFGIKVHDDEVLPENLDSVARLAAFIERKQASAVGS